MGDVFFRVRRGFILEEKRSFFTKTSHVVVMAAICAVLWGSAIPCIHIGMELFQMSEQDIPTKMLFAGYRFTLAGIFTLIYGMITTKKLVIPPRDSWGSIGILGLLQTTLQYVFFYIGLSNTTGVKGSILSATSTFMGVIIAHFFCKNDKITLQKAVGCIIGFIGVIVINMEGGGMTGGFTLTGEGFMMLAAACLGMGTVINKTATQKCDPVTVTGWQLTFGGAVLIVIGFVTGGSITVVNLPAILMLIYLALLSSVAFALWCMLLKYNPVGRVVIFNFLTPICGSILSAIILHESLLGWQTLCALALVCGGICIVNLQKKELLTPHAQK